MKYSTCLPSTSGNQYCGTTIITSSMFLKKKFAADGKFGKLKVRLVAGGQQQDRSVYSDSQLYRQRHCSS